MANFIGLASKGDTGLHPGEADQIKKLDLAPEPSTDSDDGRKSTQPGLRGDTEKNDKKPNKYNTKRKEGESLPDFAARIKKMRGE